MENWKPIAEFEGWYDVSDLGRVRRGMPQANTFVGKIRKQFKKKEGYLTVNLCVRGKVTTRYVHRLVATAFIPNPENKPEVNHQNGIKSDNRLSNLEWATISEQAVHAFDNGLRTAVVGSENGLSKITEDDVIKIFELCGQGLSESQIAKHFPITRAAIGRILRREGWAHVTLPVHLQTHVRLPRPQPLHSQQRL